MTRARVAGSPPRSGVPFAIAAPALLGLVFLLLPTVAMVARIPWSRLGVIYRDEGVWTALRLSIESSIEATAVAVILGVPLAWVLARMQFVGIAVLRAVVTIPLVLPPVIGGVALILWSIGYFVVFWSTTGQTPGARVMQIRVVTDDGTRLKPSRALLRCAGVLLAALPLFAGFIRILFDARRRGFQDRLAGTLVIEAPQTSYIAVRRAAARHGERERTPRPPPAPPSPELPDGH